MFQGQHGCPWFIMCRAAKGSFRLASDAARTADRGEEHSSYPICTRARQGNFASHEKSENYCLVSGDICFVRFMCFRPIYIAFWTKNNKVDENVRNLSFW